MEDSHTELDSAPPCKKARTCNAVEEQSIADELQQFTGVPEPTYSAVSDQQKPDEGNECVGDTVDDVLSGQVLREDDVGITEYISDHKGFHGIIKQRYSDFLVNEIDQKGEVVSLTDLSLPSCENTNSSLPDDDSILTDDQKRQLKLLKEGTEDLKEVIIPVGDDKHQRSKVHQAVREQFPGLESTTVDAAEGGSKVIKVLPASQKQRRDGRFSNKWPKNRGDYCKFVMYKENKQTMEAVNLIAKLLRIKPGAISYAGTKDKRAKTCQLLTSYRLSISRLHGLNKCLRGITLGNFRYCKNSLKLGDSKGNRFSIALRNVTGSDNEIQVAMETLRKNGFINYFGMQRFGTTGIPTHHIGRALLRSQWQEAVDLILQPRRGDLPELGKAREVWQSTKDAAAALKHLNRYHGSEKQLLLGLSRCASGDLVNALTSIPRHMRTMYVHAYQSYIWNCITSKRLSVHGYKPIVGDFVLSDRQNDFNSVEDEQVERCWPSPQVVTEDNISDYSIHQVVLPLPGHNVILPRNDVGKWYLDLLAQDELTISDFKHRVKDYSLPGGYRHIVTQAENLTWRSVSYEDSTTALMLSDKDVLNGSTLVEQDGPHKGLVMTFSLPPSAYATMALREVLKQDTSAANQTSLNPV